jgi:3D-(3,5/4)-trihydroxycyclohexane-1,2-dione acylhydrolase (decyclizing)
MVHVAAGYARQRNRLGTWAVTSSIGPGATNMVTGAALATINRLPVLLLPGDTFASRGPHPVLQQIVVLAQRLAEAGDVAVAEDAEAAGEEAVALPVALDLLRGQEADEGLSDGDPGHAATS